MISTSKSKTLPLMTLIELMALSYPEKRWESVWSVSSVLWFYCALSYESLSESS